MANFQTQVGVQPAPGIEGDFCDANPRYSVIAGPGGLVAGAAGLTAGRFAWIQAPMDDDGTPQIANNFGDGQVAGFFGRRQQGLITTYLAASTMLTPAGFPVSLFSGGGFWVKNNGSTVALPGQKAFARYADGAAIFAAAGSSPSTASITGSYAAQSAVFVGSITDDLLTVTSMTSGTIGIGAILTGGTGITTGARVVSQVSGSTGQVGVYRLNMGQMTVTSALLTGTYGLLTITAGSGVGVGDILSGGSTTAGTIITASGSAAGTWLVSPSQAGSSGTITAALAIETKWICMSTAQPGDICKISDKPMG